MDRALARQEEKPHVLNGAELSLRIFHELLEDDDGEAYSDCGGLGASADDTNVNDLEEKLKAKREEICHEETKKTYLKKKEYVPIERLILLKKIKFAEKLQENNKELKVKLDTEADEIYFEGPQQQFMEATKKFQDQILGMVEKKLSLSESILEVLSSDKGLDTVRCELEKNNVEAVVVIDSELDARVVGTSAAHADKAGSLVSRLTLEEKVQVDDKSQYLLKTSEWRQLCKQFNAETAVQVYRNKWNDTYVAGFREDVNEAMKTLTAYLDKNCIQKEQYKIDRRFLSKIRQDDLRSIEAQLADFGVKIETGKGDDDFVISGKKEGLKHAKRKLDALTDSTELEKFDVKQPGLRKDFASGQDDGLVKSVEKDQACAIQLQKQDDMRTRATEAAMKSDQTSSSDDDDGAAGGAEPPALVTRNGHKISWKPGDIVTEQVCHEETRKTYLNKKEDIPIERLTLLKKIKFVEKLQEKNKELEIKLDTEAEEIYFEGPQQQVTEATMTFHKQVSGMVEKKLSLSGSIMEVLSSDQGLQAVKYELEKNDVEAAFVIDSEARIVGTSAAQADKAESLVNKLTLEEKVPVDDKSQHLLKTSEWRQLCEQLNVRVHRNNWNDTYVAGFREDVNEAMKTLTAHLDKSCIREEQFKCPSKIVKRYLCELRQDDLRSIEAEFVDFEIKIQTGKGDDDFVISGNKEGLERAKRKLDALIDSTESEKFDVKQPGLRKYFASGKGDGLVKSVQKDHACVIQVQKQDDVRISAIDAAMKSDYSSSDDDDDDEEEERDDAVGSTDPSVLVIRNSQKISWKPGNIETEQVSFMKNV